MTWVVAAGFAVYLAGWLWFGLSLASTTDESRLSAFMAGSAWPYVVLLVAFGR